MSQRSVNGDAVRGDGPKQTKHSLIVGIVLVDCHGARVRVALSIEDNFLVDVGQTDEAATTAPLDLREVSGLHSPRMSRGSA